MSLEKDSTRNIESEISTALKRLNEIQSPTAMATRIHRRLETSIAISQPERQGWFLGSATCAAIAAILLVVIFLVHSTRRNQLSTIQTPKLGVLERESSGPVTAQPMLVPAKDSIERKVPVHTTRDIHYTRERDGYRHAANLADYPLTHQEKLLMGFVQTAKPADLQTLDPEYQADIEHQQDAEFAAYLKSGHSFNTQETTENHSTQE